MFGGSVIKMRKGVSGCHAVSTQYEVFEKRNLPQAKPSQQAELHTLTKMCQIAEGQIVHIYSDSQCGFRIVHDFGMLWKERGFLTLTETLIKNIQVKQSS